jgi:4-amino-4-deoxy-L-arabinose transferase-like glycosyltransferase
MMRFSYSKIAWLLWFALVLFALMFGLGRPPFQIWDEGRILINTLEMAQSGQWMATTFEGKPEFWNTKPPLLHWLQWASAFLFGWNEWGLRLPSAASALGVVLLILGISKGILGSYRYGFAAGLVLIVLPGYVGFHASRTADYDALLSLGTTGAFLSLWLAAERDSRYLLLTWFFLTLAVLTKGIAGLLIAPGLACIALLRYRAIPWLQTRWFWLGFVFFVFVILAYYLGRDSLQPGYLEAVWNNELGGRFAQTNEGHDHPWYYYLGVLVRHVGFGGGFLLLFGVVLAVKAESDRVRLAARDALIAALFLGVVLSSSQSKLDWYLVPMHPLLALAAGLGWADWLGDFKTLSYPKKSAVFVLILLFFATYGLEILGRNNRPTSPKYRANYACSSVLAEVLTGKGEPPTAVIFGTYDAHVRIYVKLLQRQGIRIRLLKSSQVNLGDRVLCSEPEVRASLRQKFAVDSVVHPLGAVTYTILPPLNPLNFDENP